MILDFSRLNNGDLFLLALCDSVIMEEYDMSIDEC